jgi:hypothetical protein
MTQNRHDGRGMLDAKGSARRAQAGRRNRGCGDGGTDRDRRNLRQPKIGTNTKRPRRRKSTGPKTESKNTQRNSKKSCHSKVGLMTAEAKFEADSNAFPLEELEPAPEIYVDGYQGVVIANGVAKFNYFSIYHDPLSGKNKRRIVLRLACPLDTVAGVHKALGEMIESLKKAGAIVEVDPRGKH